MTCVWFGIIGAVADAQLLDNAAGHRTWTRVNTTAYTSAVGAFAMNLYVTGDAAAYRELHPDVTRSSVTLEGPVGRLTACHSCHVPRQPDDYVFGVPQAQEVQP